MNHLSDAFATARSLAVAEADAVMTQALAETDADALVRLLRDAGLNLSPTDMSRIYNRLEQQAGPELMEKARRQVPAYRQLLKKPRGYDSFKFNEYVRLYRSHDHDAPDGRRTLVLCVTGINGGMGMMNTRLLQVIPSEHADVVMVQRDGQNDYRMGLPGIGHSLFAIAHYLDRNVLCGSYDAITVLGVSQGAIAAIAIADFIGADIGVAVGARALRIGGQVSLARHGWAWEPFCHCRNGSGRQTIPYCIYGAGNPVDARWAKQFQAFETRGIVVEVEDCEDHVVLHYLMSRGLLKGFLSELCLAPREKRPLNWP